MSIALRDTLYFKVVKGHYDEHLHIVISDPQKNADRVLVVYFTSWKTKNLVYQDSSCILQRGEHVFLKHPTLISYADAKVFSLSDLEIWERNGSIDKPYPPVSTELLNKIHKGAAHTVHLKQAFKKLLREQGFIT